MTKHEIASKVIKQFARDLMPGQKLGLARFFYESYCDDLVNSSVSNQFKP